MTICATLPLNMFLRDRGDGRPTILRFRCVRRMLTPVRGVAAFFARFDVLRETCANDDAHRCKVPRKRVQVFGKYAPQFRVVGTWKGRATRKAFGINAGGWGMSRMMPSRALVRNPFHSSAVGMVKDWTAGQIARHKRPH